MSQRICAMMVIVTTLWWNCLYLPGQGVVSERTVKMRLHKDGHWYPVNEKDWQWFGRLDGFPADPPFDVNDPKTWPNITIPNFF